MAEKVKSFAGRRCLVTGGTGLIGRQVVKILCDAGAKVTIASLDNIIVDERAELNIIDLRNFEHCKRLVADIEYVFHLAGSKGSVKETKARPADFFTNMLMVNTNVLEACRLREVERVVYTSSIGAYPERERLLENHGYKGQPMDFYPGWAKRMGEFQVAAYRVQYGLNNFAIVRLASVYGPGDTFSEDAMVIPSLMYKIRRGDNPVKVWGDGAAVRDFAYSRDVAEGIILALYHGTGSGFINLGSGRGYSVRELVETLSSFIDFNYIFDPTKPSGYPRRVMDISLAKKLIGYNPATSLLDGLQETWDWFCQGGTAHW